MGELSMLTSFHIIPKGRIVLEPAFAYFSGQSCFSLDQVICWFTVCKMCDKDCKEETLGTRTQIQH